MSFKEINKRNFNVSYQYYKDKGLNNEEVAKKLDMSIRSLYYYKKNVIPISETRITKTLKAKSKRIRKKRIISIPKRKIKEVQYIFKAICKFDSPPFKSEHYFTWIGKPGLSEEVILDFGKLQHGFWKHHELKELSLWERINVYEK